MSWLAKRNESFDSSGIRKVFDLAAKLKDPINLSIGQPDFDVPEAVKQACVKAIQSGRNGYTPTQGIAALVEKLQGEIDTQWKHEDRKVFVSSGTSGALLLAMFALVDPGDEVIVFDPYFVMYEPLVQLVGGVPVVIDTHPDFRIDMNRLASALTSKTKLILLNSPSNPTGVLADREQVRALAELAAEKNVALISDEIYRQFCYEEEFVSPAEFNEQTIVIDGFSKSHAMTGWRLGFAHGPSEIIESMSKLQQYSFVCAPQPAQWAGLVAMDTDVSHLVAQYQGKRDRLLSGLAGHFEVVKPGGAFYVYPRSPWGTGSEFVEAAIRNNLLVIPGNIFSRHDTHFRISYAAADEQIDRGAEVLVKLAQNRAAAAM
jgi:aspartate/methionine/tyrosine aminotransferase